MAELNDAPTLYDIRQAENPDGTMADVVKLLERQNGITMDGGFLPSSDKDNNVFTVEVDLPRAYTSMLGGFTPASQGQLAKVTEASGIVRSVSKVPADVLSRASNPEAERARRDMTHVRVMGNKFADMAFFGNPSVKPGEFLGLTPRYDALSGTEQSANIIDAQGTGSDNMSIWLVGWGPDTVYFHYPQTGVAGLRSYDMGVQVETNAQGHTRRVVMTEFEWTAGLTVKDWRYVARVANIDKSALTRDGSSGAKLIDHMIDLLWTIENTDGVRPSFYAPRLVLQFLDHQTKNQANMNLSYGEDVFGRPMLTFRGYPIRRSDPIAGNEAAVQ